MGPIDLSAAAVFLDYDGTISVADTGVVMLEQLATGDWRAISEEYARGVIGSRVCLLDEWDMLPKDEDRLRSTANAVAHDPDLERLVGDLQTAGATVAVVSDGFGFYVHERLGHLGVPIVTNDVDWTTGALVFPNEDRCCACSSCGTCKQAPIKDAKRQGRTTVLVGDGASDQKAALLADVLFAKDGLAQWCTRNGVAFRPFETLGDVHAGLFSE